MRKAKGLTQNGKHNSNFGKTRISTDEIVWSKGDAAASPLLFQRIRDVTQRKRLPL